MQQTIRSKIHQDLSTAELMRYAVERGEASLTADNALCVSTGKRTGRSPKDRFIVCDDMTRDTVDWGAINQPIEKQVLEALWQKTQAYLADKEYFVSNLHVGAEPKHAIPVIVNTETAWQNLFARHLFIESPPHDLQDPKVWQVLNVPSLMTDPAVDGTNSDGAVILDLSGQRVLIVGIHYAGEMKKAMFSVMNYFMPGKDILPMHCAANEGEEGDVALFFGLSGTGKTTLSADPTRFLIGDDEHGWSKQGVFNFEGGCYAKCINLSQEREPVIWNAIRDGAIMENVICDEMGVPDYTDGSLTQNTRAAYPRDFIPMRVDKNAGDLPKTVIFLTCDLYGVLPPLALLSKEQAAYYFLSGYTALVGSTEVGSAKGIQPTFSRCFGAPFFPRAATEYADLLMKRIDESGCQVFLVNTGWSGGAYGEGGERFSIPTTRAVVNAAITGQFNLDDMAVLPKFNLRIPSQLEGVDTHLLDPRNSWSDAKAYDSKADILIESFRKNFKQFDVDKAVLDVQL